MKAVIVFNHPYEGSYCHAVLAAVTNGLEQAGYEVDLMHLDRDNFDPVMRAKDLAVFAAAKQPGGPGLNMLEEGVLHYKARLEQAEQLVFIFPIWWELMPALMKGFIDKVIFPGVVYDYPEKGLRMACRLTKLKGLTVIATMNTPALMYRLLFGNAARKALMTGTFWKIGVKHRQWIGLHMVKFVKEEKRRRWLHKLERRFAQL